MSLGRKYEDPASVLMPRRLKMKLYMCVFVSLECQRLYENEITYPILVSLAAILISRGNTIVIPTPIAGPFRAK